MTESIKLIYYWMEKSNYKCFEDKEFNFSVDYEINYRSGLLVICDSEKKINVFDNLITKELSIKANVTAIVGNNGVGKTTLLEEINETLNYIRDKGDKYNNFIIVFETTQNIYVIYKGSKFKIVDRRSVNDKEIIMKRKYHFEQNFSYVLMSNDLRIEGKNLTDSKSTDSRLIENKILEGYWNTFFGTEELIINREFNNTQKLLKNKIIKEKNFLYDFIKLDYFTSEYYDENISSSSYTVRCELRKQKDRINNFFIFPIIDDFDKKYIIRYLLHELFQELILYIRNDKYDLEKKLKNKYTDLIKVIVEKFSEFRIEVTSASSDDYGVMSMFENPVKNYNKFNVKYSDYVNLKKCIVSICELFENHNVFKYFCDVVNGIDLLCELIKYNIKNYFEIDVFELRSLIGIGINKKYHNYYLFKFVDKMSVGMSTGERKVITLLSQLYFLKKFQYLYPRLKSVRSNMLIMIDELDAMLHPEWQRIILYNIIKYLNKLFPKYNFYIMFTTHSPILLSDVPKDNCIFLRMNRDKKEDLLVEKNVDEQTFGQNIYTLYKNAFFLEEGFIGEFSKKYINELQEQIDKIKEEDLYEKKDEYIKCIDVIGEPIIRKILMQKLYSRISKFESIEKCIKDLIKQRDDLTKKIEELSNKMEINKK